MNIKRIFNKITTFFLEEILYIGKDLKGEVSDHLLFSINETLNKWGYKPVEKKDVFKAFFNRGWNFFYVKSENNILVMAQTKSIDSYEINSIKTIKLAELEFLSVINSRKENIKIIELSDDSRLSVDIRYRSVDDLKKFLGILV